MRREEGFTLVELVVSISVIIFISVTIFANFPKFRQVIAVDNATRELALALREAQSRAVAISIVNGTPNNNYGIYMSTTAAEKKSFVLFTDSTSDNRYIPGASCIGECLIKYNLQGGVYIQSFAAPVVTGCTITNKMVVMYRRPDPRTDVLDNIGGVCNEYGPFTINIWSQDNVEKRKIIVWRTGQISITQ
ncbi:MAG: type II secretion system protein [Patescibacteria group bacterium]